MRREESVLGLKEAPLGKKTEYVQTYTPDLLFPIPRKLARDKIGLKGKEPFHGADIWLGSELSWLNLKGKPQIGLLELCFPASSANIVESKSLKLYLNSFSQSKFIGKENVQETIEKDLTLAIGSPVNVRLDYVQNTLPGKSLDGLDVEIETYQVAARFLQADADILVEEELNSCLLKSNCLATGQPDWGSIVVRYRGPKIEREGLLKYIVSYRNHSGFAEHCAEQIFCDLMDYCKPKKLTVQLCYTRRGGLSIHPFRSNFETVATPLRDMRC